MKIIKICSKCKTEKDLSEFSKCNKNKDKLQYWCKECTIEYAKKNSEKILEYKKEYNKKWKKENLYYYQEYKKEYHHSKANYNTYSLQISYADKVKNVDGFLQVKCAYCGKWYFPTILNIKNRIQALNGQVGNGSAESRLYCSEECKEACPIYKKVLYQTGHSKLDENNQIREVQPELRQMVFKRDNYICLKCEKHQDKLDVPLHCHHIEGIRWNPLESADINQCMTVCKDCHIKIHKQKDCGYNDMKCKRENKNEEI